jgi:UDP-glucose 4-epimerase
MKAVVIGGNGFIGTHLIEFLIRDGVSVRAFDRYPSQFVQPKKEVEYVIGDLGNHGSLAEIVQGTDWVFHLAYTTLPKTSNDDPAYDVRSNLIDAVQLLQSCKEAGVKKVIFVSSGGTVYGVPQTVPILETHPTNPICSYGITKLAIEKYLHLFYHLYGLEYAVTRISNPYGEGQNPNAQQGAIGVFLGKVARGEAIEIWGKGDVVRDYLHIDDAASALIKAARYQSATDGPRIFNIGSGTGHSLNEIVDEIKVIVDRKVIVEYKPARSLDVQSNVLDTNLARTCLDWKPTIDLNTGISRTWSWIKMLDLAKQPAFTQNK